MAFNDYSTNPDENTSIGAGIYIGPNMERRKVRPGLQQLAADGRALYDYTQAALTQIDDSSIADLNLRPQLASSAGGTYVSYLALGVGALSRTVQAKLRDVVSIRDFGAVGDSTTDDTAALQAAIDSGAKAVFVPAGDFLVSSLQMPSTPGFVLYGEGDGSILRQKAGASAAMIRWPTRATTNLVANHVVRDLHFITSAGVQNTIDTSYAQNVDLRSLFFTDVPAGKSCIFVDGNPTDGTYTHDIRICDLRVYVPFGSVINGFAGVRLGARTADTEIDRFIMQGMFQTDYCIQADANAQTVKLTGSHIYNPKKNVLKLAGNNNDWGIFNCNFDFAVEDVIKLVGANRLQMIGSYIQGITAGYSGVVLDNCANNYISGVSFNSQGGSVSCVKEINGSSGNKVHLGQIDNPANYTAPFDMPGSGSFATGFQQETPLGSVDVMSFTGTSAQAQATTIYYGANPSQATEGAAQWRMVGPGRIKELKVYTESTPPVGQTFTFNLRSGGVTIGTGTIVNGQFAATITPSSYANSKYVDGAIIAVESIFSATSGATRVTGALVVQR